MHSRSPRPCRQSPAGDWPGCRGRLSHRKCGSCYPAAIGVELPVGRDFAILMLLVRLAMRAGEVVGIELNDIDWCSGELVVRGKGDRHERLPLPSDVRRSDCWISAPRSSAHRTRPYLIRPSSGSTPKTHLHWGDQYRTRGREAGRPRQPKRAPPSAYCGDPNASRGCTT